MQMTDPELMESIVRPVAKEFVRKSYPEEAPYFSLIWEYLAKRRDAPAQGSTHGVEELSVGMTGLPFDGEEAVKFITPSLIFMLERSVARLRALAPNVKIEEIRKAVWESAKDAGASGELAERLVELVGQELFDRLRNALQSPSFPQTAKPAKNQAEPLPHGASGADRYECPLSISEDFLCVTWWGYEFPCSESQGRVVKAFDDLRLKTGKPTSRISDWKSIKPGKTGYTSIRKVFYNDHKKTHNILFGTLIVRLDHGKYYLDLKTKEDARRAFTKLTSS